MDHSRLNFYKFYSLKHKIKEEQLNSDLKHSFDYVWISNFFNEINEIYYEKFKKTEKTGNFLKRSHKQVSSFKNIKIFKNNRRIFNIIRF